MMRANLVVLLCVLGFSIGVSAQSSIEDNKVFYLNVFINENKTIYVEEEKTSFQNVQNQVAEMLHKQPFKVDQQIIFRIFGDNDLDMGYIIDVNAEMRKAIQENIKTFKVFFLDFVLWVFLKRAKSRGGLRGKYRTFVNQRTTRKNTGANKRTL